MINYFVPFSMRVKSTYELLLLKELCTLENWMALTLQLKSMNESKKTIDPSTESTRFQYLLTRDLKKTQFPKDRYALIILE